MNDTAAIIIGLVIVFGLWKTMTYKTKEEKEEELKLKKSLQDEFIYDPETGAKLTLEQAESGHWVTHNNSNRIKEADEIEQFYHGREQDAEKLINHIKSIGYTSKIFTDSEFELLETTKILSKYDDWSYSNPLSANNRTHSVFFPAVAIQPNRHHSGYHESQLMFWVKDEQLSGHYYFREKTHFESLSDIVRIDDDIKFEDYECFTIKKSQTILYTIKALTFLNHEKELEIEILDGNLFIKTLCFPSMEDFLRIEKVVKNIC